MCLGSLFLTWCGFLSLASPGSGIAGLGVLAMIFFSSPIAKGELAPSARCQANVLYRTHFSQPLPPLHEEETFQAGGAGEAKLEVDYFPTLVNGHKFLSRQLRVRGNRTGALTSFIAPRLSWCAFLRRIDPISPTIWARRMYNVQWGI